MGFIVSNISSNHVHIAAPTGADASHAREMNTHANSRWTQQFSFSCAPSLSCLPTLPASLLLFSLFDDDNGVYLTPYEFQFRLFTFPAQLCMYFTIFGNNICHILGVPSFSARLPVFRIFRFLRWKILTMRLRRLSLGVFARLSHIQTGQHGHTISCAPCFQTAFSTCWAQNEEKFWGRSRDPFVIGNFISQSIKLARKRHGLLSEW